MKRVVRAASMTLIAATLGLTLALVPSQFSPEQTAAAAGIVGPYPHPQFPNIDVYMDDAGIFFARADAYGQTDVLKRTGTAALNQAQSVPGSYYNRMTAAAKAGTTSAVNSVNKVLTVAGSSKYAPAAVLQKAGALAGAPAKVVTAAGKSASKVLATGTGALMKVAGPVSVGLAGYQLGIMVGNNTVDMLGIDGDALVCTSDGADFLSLLTMRDCDAFNQLSVEALAAANADVTEGVSGGRVCKVADPGRCLTLVGLGITGGPQGIPYRYYLFRSEGTPLPGIFWEKATGELRSGTSGLDPAAADTLGMRCKAAQQGGTSFRCIEAGSVSSGAANELVRYSPDQFNTPGGTVAEVVSSESDPERVLSCTITGTDGNSYTAQTAGFREASGDLPTPECPNLPEGVYPANVTLTEDGGGQSHPLYDEPTTPEYQQLAVAYPECMDGSCMLDLRTEGASCFEGLSDCATWVTDPEKDTKYDCRYGTHNVPLSDCYIYGQLFKPGVAAGNSPWADPETGGAVPGKQAPTVSDNVMGNDVAAADQTRECWPTGWAVLNPVEWVWDCPWFG